MSGRALQPVSSVLTLKGRSFSQKNLSYLLAVEKSHRASCAASVPAGRAVKHGLEVKEAFTVERWARLCQELVLSQQLYIRCNRNVVVWKVVLLAAS